MSAFAIDLELLQDVIDRMCAFERNLSQSLEDLNRCVARLQGTWSGAAAAEQRRAHQEWLAGAQQMEHAVTVLRRIGATAHANYSAAIAANRAMWG